MDSINAKILDFIRTNPGCATAAVNAAVRDKDNTEDWIYTRRDIDGLIQAGLVEQRYFRGIICLYVKDKA